MTPKRSSARSFPRATARSKPSKRPTSSSTTPAPFATKPSRKSSTASPTTRNIRSKARSSACSAASRSRKAKRFSSARPYVSMVCGSASYRNLPQMLVQIEAGNRRVTGLDDRQTDECFETEFTVAHQSASRLHHHHRRLRQVLRLLRGAVHARQGAQPHLRLRARRSPPDGRSRLHRNSVARPERQFLPGSGREEVLRRTAGRRRRSPRHPPRALHHLASARLRPRHRRCHRRRPDALRSRPSAGAERLDPRARRHAAPLHARAIPRTHRVDEIRASAISASPPTSSSASPARPKRISSRPSACSTTSNTTASSLSNIRRGPTLRRCNWTTPFPTRKSRAAWPSCMEHQRDIQKRRNERHCRPEC